MARFSPHCLVPCANGDNMTWNCEPNLWLGP